MEKIQTFEQKLVNKSYNGKKIMGAALLENYNGYKLMFWDSDTTETISVGTASRILTDQVLKDNIELIKSDYLGPAITVVTGEDKLYIDLGQNRVLIEPKYRDNPCFAIYPQLPVDFFDRVNKKVDLHQIYKDWYKETYGKDYGSDV